MTSRRKTHDLVFLVDGTQNLVKGVTKETTCSDIINTIYKDQDILHSFAVFESSRGIDRILPGKAKVLKVIRSWGTEKEIMEFVIRRTDALASAPKVSHAKRRLLKIKTSNQAATARAASTQSMTSREDYHVTRKIHNVEMLAEMVSNQRQKLACLNENKMSYSKSNDYVKEIYFNNDSLDDFMSNVDSEKMTGFLNFCGTVTANEIQRLQGVAPRPSATIGSPNIMISSDEALRKKSNDVKFAVKKCLRPSVTGSKRESTSNIHHQTPKRTAERKIVKHTFIENNFLSGPVCSTPISGETRYTHIKLSDRPFKSQVNAKLPSMNQSEGKRALLKRYFKDYNTYASPAKRCLLVNTDSTSTRECGDGVDECEAPFSFRSGDGSAEPTSPQLRSLAERCKSYWTKSASGHSSEDEFGGLDVAFINESFKERDGCTDSPKPSTSQQTSGTSPSKGLVAYDASVAEVTKIVDYSLSDDESSAYADNSACSLDNSTHSYDNGSNQEQTDVLNINVIESDSDEGLSSLGSDDVTEDRGIFV